MFPRQSTRSSRHFYHRKNAGRLMDFFQNFGGVHRRLAYYPEASAGNGQVFSEELIAPKIEPNDQNLKGYGQDQVPSKRMQADWRNALCKLRDFGAGSRGRTRDPLITNQVLYQLSYTGQCALANIGSLQLQESYSRAREISHRTAIIHSITNTSSQLRLEHRSWNVRCLSGPSHCLPPATADAFQMHRR
jgi:hypothetical protein